MRWLILAGLLWIALCRLLGWFRQLTRPRGDDPKAWKSVDFVYDEVVNTIDRQSQNWERMDDRLRFILGVVGIVFAAVLTFRATSNAGTLIQVPWWVAAPAALSLGLYLSAAYVVARVYQVADFNRPPNPVTLRDEYLTEDPRRTKLDVIDTINVAYNRNALIIEKKADAFNRAFVLTALATLLLGVAIIAQVLSNADVAGLLSFWAQAGTAAQAIWSRVQAIWSTIEETLRGLYGR